MIDLDPFEDHVFAALDRLYFHLHRPLQQTREQLLRVSLEEVHLPGSDAAVHEASDDDEVVTSLDDRLREQQVVPRAEHELANEHILDRRLRGPLLLVLQVR